MSRASGQAESACGTQRYTATSPSRLGRRARAADTGRRRIAEDSRRLSYAQSRPLRSPRRRRAAVGGRAGRGRAVVDRPHGRARRSAHRRPSRRRHAERQRDPDNLRASPRFSQRGGLFRARSHDLCGVVDERAAERGRNPAAPRRARRGLQPREGDRGTYRGRADRAARSSERASSASCRASARPWTGASRRGRSTRRPFRPGSSKSIGVSTRCPKASWCSIPPRSPR